MLGNTDDKGSNTGDKEKMLFEKYERVKGKIALKKDCWVKSLNFLIFDRVNSQTDKWSRVFQKKIFLKKIFKKRYTNVVFLFSFSSPRKEIKKKELSARILFIFFATFQGKFPLKVNGRIFLLKLDKSFYSKIGKVDF